jgi:hypothetical protein
VFGIAPWLAQAEVVELAIYRHSPQRDQPQHLIDAVG